MATNCDIARTGPVTSGDSCRFETFWHLGILFKYLAILLARVTSRECITMHLLPLPLKKTAQFD